MLIKRDSYSATISSFRCIFCLKPWHSFSSFSSEDIFQACSVHVTLQQRRTKTYWLWVQTLPWLRLFRCPTRNLSLLFWYYNCEISPVLNCQWYPKFHHWNFIPWLLPIQMQTKLKKIILWIILLNSFNVVADWESIWIVKAQKTPRSK